MPRYKHVLLDFDRTLNDSDYVYEKNLEGFLGLTGREVLQLWESVHRIVLAKHPKRHADLDLHYKMMTEELNRTTKAEVTAELRRRIRAAQEECWYATALFEETFGYLDAMAGAGYTLHLATGDYAKTKVEHIESRAGRSYFKATFDEETLGVGKGKRDYFDRALERLCVRPESAVVVGDSLTNDIQPGRDAGMDTIWIRRKGEVNKRGVVPTRTFATLTASLAHFTGPA